MRNTPQRTRNYASPTRDKIFIWSAVVAGCGIMAYLVVTPPFTISAQTNLPAMYSLPFSLSFQSVFIAVFNQ